MATERHAPPPKGRRKRMIECHKGQYEMTIVTMRGETQEAGVYTSDPNIANTLDEICKQYPMAAQVTEIKSTIPRGNKLPKVESKRYKLQKDIVQFCGEKGKPIFEEPAKPKKNEPMPEEDEEENQKRCRLMNLKGESSD